jgi:hypothetical protein
MKNYLVIIIGAVLSLTACHQQKTYNYFLLHPRDLESTYEYCSQLSGPEAYNNQECVAAINAAQTLKDLLMSLINNRQEFGQKLLDTQMLLGKTQEDLAKAKAQLQALKKSSAGTEELTSKQQEVSQLMESEQRQEFDIKMMWGVLRLLQPQFGG